jgi:hypothetical protein
LLVLLVGTNREKEKQENNCAVVSGKKDAVARNPHKKICTINSEVAEVVLPRCYRAFYVPPFYVGIIEVTSIYPYQIFNHPFQKIICVVILIPLCGIIIIRSSLVSLPAAGREGI